MSDIAAKLVLDINGAIQSIEQFTKKSSESLSGLNKSASLIATSFVALAGAFVVDKLIAGIGEVVKEASLADDAVTKLNVSLKLSGDYSAGAQSDFEKLASSLQSSTRYSDEQVLSSVTMAKALGLSNAETKKLTQASVDLAAITGQDLQSATQVLLNSYSGNVKALGKLIPQVKNLTESQLAAGGAVTIAGQKFHGAAEALAGTFSGAVDIAKNQFSDLLEVLGQLITRNPVIIQLIQQLGSIFRSFGEYVSKNKTSIGEFINSALIGMVNAIPPVLTLIQALAAGIGVLNKITAIAAMTVLQWIRAFLNFKEISLVFEVLAKSIAGFVTLLLSFINTLLDVPGIGSTFKAAGFDVSEIQTQLGKLEEQALQFGRTFRGDSIVKGIDEIGTQIGGTFDSVDNILGNMGSKFGIIKSGAQNLAESLTSIGKTQADALETATEKLKNQAKILLQLSREQRKELIGGASKNPISGLFSIFNPSLSDIKVPIDPSTGKPISGTGTALGIGSTLGGLSNILQGESGAKSLVSAGAGAAADAFLPGSGAAVQQIVAVLAEGPDKVKEMVQGFVQAIPSIVKNILKAVPILIVELIKGVPKIIKEIVHDLPEIIEALIESIPDIIEAFIEALPDIADAWIELSPRIIEGMFRGFNKLIARMFGDGLGDVFAHLGDGLLKIPDVILTALRDGIGSIFSRISGGGSGGGLFGIPGLPSLPGISILPGLGGSSGGSVPFLGSIFSGRGIGLPGFGLGNLMGGIGSSSGGLGIHGSIGGWDFGFAEGGLIPSGYPGDSFRALLSSGELILPQRQAKSYQEVMGDGPESFQRKLEKLERNGGGGQSLTINLQVGEKNLASTILDLSRMGFRLS